jgi:hypothetical protein
MNKMLRNGLSNGFPFPVIRSASGPFSAPYLREIKDDQQPKEVVLKKPSVSRSI